MNPRIKLLRGDITKIAAGAIVNAANGSLLGGGGVDGAIHRAAGPGLLAECRTLGGCETGKAKLTKGYNLTAPYVIHAVGPVWRGGTGGEEALLAGAYRSALDLAAENGIRSVAFPNISTGVYGYPKDKAAAVAIRTVSNFLDGHPEMDKVIFVCFDEDNHRLYERRLGG
ncbi:MAG TPA: O-acetyl-ADP-ribose deacetylase [Candidatus Aminicenantes bacterium]|nr:O-acetyl-ADP-ribose deacetylase [Candidatus Aminicenantes bacterium]HNT30813.1 O-acetyl-ADP-ribose deacetylase [Candidatus Aminicenantes bacterium]HOU48930.1 O-acetyl-ADP-ribose deacetylase [Candidatus Aminicenantes bacterium]HPH44437.1 O-acetyl-ADP-ribose deacetylase [Candidatus Aminicenantes bacterium]HQJ43115.1 O-acetyl-ADP-ribose deacetylase [Candidatus Aminicenantes bacterium]